jgi:cell wall assembly regulator SMI1
MIKFRRVIIVVASSFLALFVGIVVIKHICRNFFYPSPGEMPPMVADDVRAGLQRLESTLAIHAPGVLAALRPGLPDSEISAIEAGHGIRLTDDLRALYRWRDGSPPSVRGELIPGHWFVPLEEALRMREGMRTVDPDATVFLRAADAVLSYKQDWLPVLDDGAGDGYFYDPSRPHGSFFYNFAEDGQYRFFPSLANFLAGAVECYECGAYRSDPRGGLSENFVRSHALWPRYASWPGR